MFDFMSRLASLRSLATRLHFESHSVPLRLDSNSPAPCGREGLSLACGGRHRCGSPPRRADLWVLWAYDNKPGTAANPSPRWPATSRLAPAADGPTLVLFAHPQCSCSPASLGELAEVLARVRTRPRTYVVFLKPSGVADGWERTALWQTAAQIENVTVVRDDDGLEAQRFSAATSGQTFLYDSAGSAAVQRRHHRRARARRRQRRTGGAHRAPGSAARPATAARTVFGCSLFAAAK